MFSEHGSRSVPAPLMLWYRLPPTRSSGPGRLNGFHHVWPVAPLKVAREQRSNCNAPDLPQATPCVAGSTETCQKIWVAVEELELSYQNPKPHYLVPIPIMVMFRLRALTATQKFGRLDGPLCLLGLWAPYGSWNSASASWVPPTLRPLAQMSSLEEGYTGIIQVLIKELVGCNVCSFDPGS